MVSKAHLNEQIVVRFPRETVERLRAIADAEEYTVAQIVRLAVRRYLDERGG